MSRLRSRHDTGTVMTRTTRRQPRQFETLARAVCLLYIVRLAISALATVAPVSHVTVVQVQEFHVSGSIRTSSTRLESGRECCNAGPPDPASMRPNAA